MLLVAGSGRYWQRVAETGGRSVDYHLERGLRLHTEPEYKNLYAWAIHEVDGRGKKIGPDQIPWPYTLNFTATSCSITESIDIKSYDPPEIMQRQVIRVTLRPGTTRDDENFHRQTTFSMFGTDRIIKSFQLDIHPITDPAEQESCKAWGSVSYTSEIDFTNVTEDDCVVFYLYVTPAAFTRYAAKIANGLIDEIVLSVGSVDGFYSEWSPSISTRNVKVLTRGSEQGISFPKGEQIELPRLGQVGTADLYIGRRLEFQKHAVEPEASADVADFGSDRAVPETRTPVPLDPQILLTMTSLRRAAWFVVSLLALILIATLLNS